MLQFWLRSEGDGGGELSIQQTPEIRDQRAAQRADQGTQQTSFPLLLSLSLSSSIPRSNYELSAV